MQHFVSSDLSLPWFPSVVTSLVVMNEAHDLIEEVSQACLLHSYAKNYDAHLNCSNEGGQKSPSVTALLISPSNFHLALKLLAVSLSNSISIYANTSSNTLNLFCIAH